MKKLLYPFMALLLFACEKQESASPFLGRLGDGLRPEPWFPVPPLTPIPFFPRIPITICIDSYEELAAHIGRSVVEVSGVELEDGTLIDVGGQIKAIKYLAYPTGEPNSLFRSKLWVECLVNGVVQTFTTDTWSLGCQYPDIGAGPYTNLQQGNKVLQINTVLSWPLPPFAHRRIRKIIL